MAVKENQPSARTPFHRAVFVLKHVNCVVLCSLSAWLFLAPVILVARDLIDPRLDDGRIPAAAFRMLEDLAPKYERWARERVASGRAAALSTEDVSGTEWPVFGSVFFLWATEELQAAWDDDPSLAGQAPKVTARGAIDAARDLVLDPSHGGWVRRHWGATYLRRENVFYRALLIAAITSHNRLTGSSGHLERLRTQVEGLTAELDASPHGLLDDYPGECYPGDILATIAIIRAWFKNAQFWVTASPPSPCSSSSAHWWFSSPCEVCAVSAAGGRISRY